MTMNVDAEPPESEFVTDYDRTHLATFMRLLDADRQGVPWQEAAKTLFGSDANTDEAALRAQHAAHLKRARWLVTSGYLQLAAIAVKPPT